MKVNPISMRVVSNSINNNQLGFTGNKSSQKENKLGNESSRAVVALRDIPLAVLLAISPLNVANAQAQNNTQQVQVEQNTLQTNPIRREKAFITDNDKTYQFIKVDNDNDSTNYEGLFFEYKEKDSPNTLRGRIICIVDEPDSIGEYYGVYQKVNKADNNLNDMEVCKLTDKCANYVLNFANSNKNNEAVIKADFEEFEESFTDDEIKNAKRFTDILKEED